MIIDDILTRFETVIEGQNEAKHSRALKVRDTVEAPDEPTAFWHGAVYIDVPDFPNETVAFGDPGKAEFEMVVEVTIGWDAHQGIKAELPKALHTVVRVQHAIETDTGWPSGCNSPVFVGGERQFPRPEDTSIWALVQRFRVLFTDTFPETT